MKERILQLCKRLNKFTLDEIATISEMDTKIISTFLNELILENKLTQSNGEYFYCKKVSVIKKYPLLTKYPAIIIDTIIRCFCESINTTKTANITGVSETQVQKIYTIFRTIVYKRQKKLLDSYYFQKPQNARHRIFFNKEVYLYIYSNQVFISSNLLKSKKDAPLNKSDKAEFSKQYCYLNRHLFHNKNKYHLQYKIAEVLWRRESIFKELYIDLKQNLLNIA